MTVRLFFHRWTGTKARRKSDPRPLKEPKLPTIDAIADDFAFLTDWDDRYRYIIELGRALEPLTDPERNASSKVSGCVSQVWIVSRRSDDGRLNFRGDSDSTLVKGLVAIAFALFDGKIPAEIHATDAIAAFRALGLETHLTPQRSNGVRAMIQRIKADAAAG